MSSKIVLFNKPFQVLTQFNDSDGRDTLKKYIDIPNVYPAGRLDRDSEGLLLLTDDGALQHQISHPKYNKTKTYWVQVERIPNESDLEKLRQGVVLKDGLTKPAEVKMISPPDVWERTPAVRFRQSIPTQWLEISITEGKNRQVRRMTAAIGYPTLRLIRVRIGDYLLGDLAPGEFKVINLVKNPKKYRTKRN
jgi:23S rRNA pseudouridine2457 synthase